MTIVFMPATNFCFATEPPCTHTGNNLISNGNFEEDWTSTTIYNGVFEFYQRYRTLNPWILTRNWNIIVNDQNQISEILPNSGTPDLFRAIQNTNDINDISKNNVQTFPCSKLSNTETANEYGTQAPCGNNLLNCPSPNYLTSSYAGLGYYFSYDAFNKLQPNEDNYGQPINNQWAEYLVQKLSTPLEQSKTYKLSFKISKADQYSGFSSPSTDISLKYFGALFTSDNDKITFHSSASETNSIDYFMNSGSYWQGIKVLNTTLLDQNGNYPGDNTYYNHWMEISGYFKPCVDNLQYIYIGHFNQDIKEEIGTKYDNCTSETYSCYYFISDVWLEEVSSCSIPQNCNCANSDDYYIFTEPEITPETNPCPKCCTKIKIQKNLKEGNRTWNWNCKFNFIKIDITGNSLDSPVSTLIEIKESDYNRFAQGDTITVYRICDNQTTAGSDILISTQMFNTSTECTANAGWWGNKKSPQLYTMSCACKCSDITGSNSNSIQLVQEGADIGTCCYILKITNNSTDCNLLINNIVGQIKFQQNDGTYDFITNNSGFTFSGNDSWTALDPFGINSGNNHWQCSWKNNRNVKYIVPEATSDICRICLPPDGISYKLQFFASTDLLANPYYCASDEYIKSCPPPISDCCNKITANFERDLSQPDKCCYYLYIKYNNPGDSVACRPVNFSVTDNTNGSNLTIRESYDYRKYDLLKGKQFGSYCLDGSGSHILEADIFFDDNGVKKYCPTSQTVLCTGHHCCGYLSVTHGEPTTNSTDQCCFTFNINSSGPIGCIPVSFTIKDETTNYEWPPIISPAMNHNYPNIPICLEQGSITHYYLFTFTMPDGDTCQMHDSLSCPCPCPPDKNEWLKVEILKNQNCGAQNNCRVSLGLEIPESITCWKYVSTNYTTSTYLASEFNSIPQLATFCLTNNTTQTITIDLENEDHTEHCIISQNISCDNTVAPGSLPTDCLTECSDIWTTLTRTFNLDGCGPITVNFSYRNACGFQSLRINWLFPAICIEKTQEQIYQDVLVSLINIDYMGFIPLPFTIGCNSEWRVVNQDCWKLSKVIIPPFTESNLCKLVPCQTPDSCCLQGYTVCRDPKLTITPCCRQISPNLPECENIPQDKLKINPPVDLFKCHTSCDWLIFTYVEEFFHKASIDAGYENNIIGYQCNFDSGNLVITKNNQEKSNIKVEIYDLLGNMINHYDKNMSENTIKINFDNLISFQGVYIYQVYLNNVLYCVGKYLK